MAKTKPKVVGLDLSITATGIAKADGKAITVGGKSLLGDFRLVEILNAVLKNLNADYYIIEDLPTHAHGAGKTGMVHGVVRSALLNAGKTYALVPPASLKKYATGKGNANKTEMTLALFKHTGLELKDDNQVDATWLRYMGLDHLGYPEVELPEANRDTMKKINWEWD